MAPLSGLMLGARGRIAVRVIVGQDDAGGTPLQGLLDDSTRVGGRTVGRALGQAFDAVAHDVAGGVQVRHLEHLIGQSS